MQMRKYEHNTNRNIFLNPNKLNQRLHFFEKGQEIPNLTGGVWQVYRGTVELSMLHSNEKKVLLGWAYPLTFFGSWLTYTEAYQGKAISDVYLKWYYLTEIEASAQLAKTMLTQMARRMRQTEALLAIAGMRRVEDRLQQLFVLLKHEIGEPVPGGTKLKIRLTHQSIANTIGSSRATVTRLFSLFQRNGSISFDSDRQIILLDDHFR
ncbi:MAG: Crp/Fnr family transcriptional regulator [Prochloraceae cyanobacterium]